MRFRLPGEKNERISLDLKRDGERVFLVADGFSVFILEPNGTYALCPGLPSHLDFSLDENGAIKERE